MKIFFTDTSFDHKTKTAMAGIYELGSGTSFQEVFKASSPAEGEFKGILRASDLSIDELNVTIFCDSKKAVAMAKRYFFQERRNPRNRYLQIVWLPREYMSLADHLSRTVSDNETAEKLSSMRTQVRQEAALDLASSITDIKGSVDASVSEIRETIQTLSPMLKGCRSRLFSGVEKLSDEEILSSPVDEIEEIEADIATAKNPIIAQTMRHILNILIAL